MRKNKPASHHAICVLEPIVRISGGEGIREMEVGIGVGRIWKRGGGGFSIDFDRCQRRLAHAQQQGQKNMEVCSEIHQMGMVAFHTSYKAYPSWANAAIRSGGCSISIKSENQESMMCAICIETRLPISDSPKFEKRTFV